jgi:pyruvate ferredoxin oxidoreductase alpha subunit
VEPMVLLEQDRVDEFLPPFSYPYALDPDRPVTMGAFTLPNMYTEAKKSQDVALRATKPVIAETFERFGDTSDRHYHFVEQYRTEDANVLLLTMGSFSETAMVAVDSLRDEGQKVGLIRLRLWRPFPFEEIRKAVEGVDVLIVLDRCISFGGPGGPVCSEVKAALYSQEKRPRVVGFIGGLGGRDITVAQFAEMILRGVEIADQGIESEAEIVGVRE